MNEYSLFMDENEYKLVRLLVFMAGLEEVDYTDLTNEKLYVILKTLALAANGEAHKKLLDKEVEKMENWYQNEIFYSELEEVFNNDEV